LLIEMMIVLALVCVFCLLGIQSINWTQHRLVRLELDALCFLLLACSQHAVCTGTTCIITCNQSGTLVSPVGQHALAQGIRFGAPATVKGPPSAPQHAITTPITFVDQRIVCYPDGTLSSGTLYLTTDDYSCAYALSCPVGTINYLRRYRAHHNKWKLLT
jgi:hypothetical protein